MFNDQLAMYRFEFLNTRYYIPGACLDIFQKGFTNFFVFNLPLKYAYLRYALPVKYALCVLRIVRTTQYLSKKIRV